jgi:hypothetical protein
MLSFKDLDIYYGIKNEAENAYIDYKYIRGYLISDKECTVKKEWKKQVLFFLPKIFQNIGNY